MNPNDMRGLFDDALADPPPIHQASTDDLVAAGKRSHRRRRAAQAGASTLAAAAALALIAAAPMVFGRGGAVPLVGEGEGDPCPSPTGESTQEQAAVAAMYDQALDDSLARIGGAVADSCVKGEADYDGFHYDSQTGGYRFDEIAVFAETDERVALTVDVLAPTDEVASDRMEWLAECGAIDGTCTWREGWLLVEEVRTVVVDAEENAAGESVPYHGALVGFDDGTVVHVQMGVVGGPGTLSTTPEQLAVLAAAVPVGEEPPEPGETEGESIGPDDELILAFTDAVASQIPGAVLDVEAPIDFVPQGPDFHYGQDDTDVAAVEAVVDGQTVTLFLQKTPIDAPGDGGAGQTAAEHYSLCDDAADCEFTEVDESTSRVHRTSTGSGTELTSIEFRAGSGWVFGVGVEADGGTPPIGFATLDAMVARIG